MKINEMIRKYRKEANLTQEQVANYLGVSAPAVNKWENGISCPDIGTLVPLARILKINVDTLLSFHEELSPLEMNQLIMEVSDLAESDGFQAAFVRGEELIREYPCCDMLTLSLAQILNMNLTIEKVEQAEAYERKITGWYELVAEGKEEYLVTMAKVSLINQYMEKGEYDKTQRLLDKIPPLGYDKQMTQAALYFKQGEDDMGYEICERMIYKAALEINNSVLILIDKMLQKKQYEEAEKYAHIAKESARLLELGSFMEHIPDYGIAMEHKDIECSMDALEAMVAGINFLSVNTDSYLYSHMKKKEDTGRNMIKEMVQKGLRNDDELNFLRGEKRFQELMKQLDKIEN